MYLLDTNHCSLAINNQSDILAKLAKLHRSQVSICVIVQAELIYMAENSQQRESNLNRVREFLKNILIYEIDKDRHQRGRGLFREKGYRQTLRLKAFEFLLE